MPDGHQRRLAAIMFIDLVGYTAIGQRNESLSLALVQQQRGLIRPILEKYDGREVKTMGDAFLVEFQSALGAVGCAYEIQRAARDMNFSLPSDQRIQLRIGIHIGDVVESEGDISGDAVNVASRIEPLAEGGGVCLSRQVHDSVENKFDLPMESLGLRQLKNVITPLEVYKIKMPWNEEARAKELKKNRIAVLPLTNISRDPADEFLADGMTEELISTMSRISGLRVIARTSVMTYKTGQKKISEIASELEVGSVLEGSVRRIGDRVRVSVQLIDSQTSEHLWSESYDRDLKDVFSVQSDISKLVAESLKVQLPSFERKMLENREEVNPEAYTSYLKGRFFWSERTRDSVNTAIRYLEGTTKIDPKFAQAYSGLADCYNILADYSWMNPREAGALARDYSMKALEINDSLAEAHASLALTLMSHFWDFAAAEREIKKAIELRPNYAIAYHWYAILLYHLRRHEEAYIQEKRAIDIDPYSKVIGMGLAIGLAQIGRIQEALERFTRVIDSNPDFGPVRFWESMVLSSIGEHNKAIEEAEKAVEVGKNSDLQLNLARLYGRAGRIDEAKKTLQDVVSRSGTEYVSPVIIGSVELELGNLEEGFKWMEKGLAAHDSKLLDFGSFLWFEKFRGDARWKRIDRKIGIPQNQ